MGDAAAFASEGIRVKRNRYIFTKPVRSKNPGTPPAWTLDKSLVCEENLTINGGLTITSPGALVQVLSAGGLPWFAQTVAITDISTPTLWAYFPLVTGYLNHMRSIVHEADGGAGVGQILLADISADGSIRYAEAGITIAAAPAAEEIDEYDVLSNAASNPIMKDLSLVSYGSPLYIYAYQPAATAGRNVTVTIEIEAI